MCCGWVPCFLASCPFRSRDEFFVVVRSYSIYQLERFTRSNDVLTLDNVYIPLFVRIAWSCQTYIYPWLYGLVGFVQISLQVDLHLTMWLSVKARYPQWHGQANADYNRARLASPTTQVLEYSQRKCILLVAKGSISFLLLSFISHYLKVLKRCWYIKFAVLAKETPFYNSKLHFVERSTLQASGDLNKTLVAVSVTETD